MVTLVLRARRPGVAMTVLFFAVQLAVAGSTDERIQELEQRIDALSNELERRSWGGGLVPEVIEGEYGMGAAASKVYQSSQGVTLGGYGEALYQNFENDKTDELDLVRAVLYVGYKFNDEWVFNMELELEHASTDKEGSSSAEFAYLDYLYDPKLNFRAGLVLIPMGLVNELHEPNAYLSAKRPTVENQLIPTTWRENGIGIFGELGPVSYKGYMVNGLRGERFDASGIRGGRQKGSKAIAEDFAWVGRLDWTITTGLTLGGSAYYGNSGQDLEIDLNTQIYDVHLDWAWRGLDFKALAVIVNLDDVEALNRVIGSEGGTVVDADIESVGSEMVGWYVQAGYDLFSTLDMDEQSLAPFVRFERINTQDGTPSGFKEDGKFDLELVTVGINYKPIDEIVFKVDYQFADNNADGGTDQLNLALGYVF